MFRQQQNSMIILYYKLGGQLSVENALNAQCPSFYINQRYTIDMNRGSDSSRAFYNNSQITNINRPYINQSVYSSEATQDTIQMRKYEAGQPRFEAYLTHNDDSFRNFETGIRDINRGINIIQVGVQANTEVLTAIQAEVKANSTAIKCNNQLIAYYGEENLKAHAKTQQVLVKIFSVLEQMKQSGSSLFKSQSSIKQKSSSNKYIKDDGKKFIQRDNAEPQMFYNPQGRTQKSLHHQNPKPLQSDKYNKQASESKKQENIDLIRLLDNFNNSQLRMYQKQQINNKTKSNKLINNMINWLKMKRFLSKNIGKSRWYFQFLQKNYELIMEQLNTLLLMSIQQVISQNFLNSETFIKKTYNSINFTQKLLIEIINQIKINEVLTLPKFNYMLRRCIITAFFMPISQDLHLLGAIIARTISNSWQSNLEYDLIRKFITNFCTHFNCQYEIIQKTSLKILQNY